MAAVLACGERRRARPQVRRRHLGVVRGDGATTLRHRSAQARSRERIEAHTTVRRVAAGHDLGRRIPCTLPRPHPPRLRRLRRPRVRCARRITRAEQLRLFDRRATDEPALTLQWPRGRREAPAAIGAWDGASITARRPSGSVLELIETSPLSQPREPAVAGHEVRPLVADHGVVAEPHTATSSHSSRHDFERDHEMSLDLAASASSSVAHQLAPAWNAPTSW